MASEAGRGAQVRLDEAARQRARGGGGGRLIDNIRDKHALEQSGAAPTGDTPDGSLRDGTAADDEVLLPGGLPVGLGGGGVTFAGGAVVVAGVLYVIPPGPFPDDATAAVAGVPPFAAYRHASGIVKWREA